MENWEAWLSISVALSLLVGLAFRVATADVLALIGLAAIMLAQNVTGTKLLPSPTEAVAGFGNAGLITVALLFAAVAGLEFTGGTQLATGWLLDKARTLRGAQFRLLAPAAIASAFLNNTPIVAALLPVTDDLSKRLRVSPSRLLLPLSYAVILGGLCTLMGTSTNLIVRDLYEQRFNSSLSFFAPAPVGIPALVVVLVYMITCSRVLLRDRRPAVSASDDPKQYTVEVQVDPAGPLVGKTVEEAGLRHLPGLYLAEIQRENNIITAAKPSERLLGGDALILVGALDTVVDLRKIRGLISPDDQARKLQVPAWRRTLVEAVVSARCSLLGKTIREGQFRSQFGAAVVAVARGDRRLSGKIGDVRLEVGDVLLLEAAPSFMHRQRELRDFILVSAVEKAAVRRHDRAALSVIIMLGLVAVAALNVASILTASLIGALLMVLCRCCTQGEALRSVEWSVLIVIGAAIGIGNALDKSGAASSLANGLLELAGGNPLWSLAAVYLATMLTTELVTNNAAAVLMFSIATSAAAKLGVDVTPFVIVVMIAASASFLTPFGYQTNMMVYGAGAYRISDYVRFGLPVTLILFALSMVIVPWYWPLVSK
ncbi:MAG: SLC13 family permease [Pirellulaceae bacterium]|nr:SLC13 family permease [Pirellulaceae bacterium]